jgi:hypothetical protein
MSIKKFNINKEKILSFTKEGKLLQLKNLLDNSDIYICSDKFSEEFIKEYKKENYLEKFLSMKSL